MAESFSISAVGDISFMGRYADQPDAAVFSGLVPFLQDSYVVANLECPLIGQVESVPGKCTLRGSPGWATIMKNAGINMVSLANNHMMDYGEKGLFSTLEALTEAGILFLGAGLNCNEACAPVFLEITGQRVAFLARSSVVVSSPSYYAEKNRAGIAFFEKDKIIKMVKHCKQEADFVVLLMHWGLEEYSYPTPEQRFLANELIQAGVDIILGHHPHVLQGVEKIGQGVVAYSLGNFIFYEFEWSIQLPDNTNRILISSLSNKNRQGMVLSIATNDKEGFSVNKIFARINENARIEKNNAPALFKEFDLLIKNLALPFYQYWWKVYSLKREWDLRIKNKINFAKLIRNIRKIRPRHFKELLDSFRRSAKITSGKSTNPYE